MKEIVEQVQWYIAGACIVALALLFLGSLAYKMRSQLDVALGFIRRHPFQSAFLAPCLLSLWVYGSTKPTPVTPTVKGLTLGEPMESPGQVALAWHPDEGTEIGTNQLVKVYWRDAANTAWNLAHQGYGITNATITGFFINRDTDWLVEVEGTNTTQEVQQ